MASTAISPAISPVISYVALFARDPGGLAAFYASVFGFPEVVPDRSPIYHCLQAGAVRLGFHADKAYDLLDIADRRPGDRGVTCYFTVEVASVTELDKLCARAVDHGALLVKPSYVIYYGSQQCVLTDPEGNVFRINHIL
jgi:predicted enzyme related to lactoylglutathione lyase